MRMHPIFRSSLLARFAIPLRPSEMRRIVLLWLLRHALVASRFRRTPLSPKSLLEIRGSREAQQGELLDLVVQITAQRLKLEVALDQPPFHGSHRQGYAGVRKNLSKARPRHRGRKEKTSEKGGEPISGSEERTHGCRARLPRPCVLNEH